MSALRTTLVGVLVTAVGLTTAFTAARGAASMVDPGVETYAHTPPELLIVGGGVVVLVGLATWSLGHLPGSFGGEP